MRVNSEILAALSEATPGLRRYARALGAGAAAAVADGLVQKALQSVGARLFARELRPAGPEEARLEAYIALTALAARKPFDAPPPGPRHPAIIHGLKGLPFEERAVLLLISLEGFGYDAVARIVGAPRENVLTWLRRARRSLSGDVEAAEAVDAPRHHPQAPHLRIVK
jgi:DNA-directed RNA polymerase specialized sigma24 family protein